MQIFLRTRRTRHSTTLGRWWTGGLLSFWYPHVILLSLPPGKKSDEENFFEIITADEVHYYLQAATPKERTEWIKAIQTVSRTGK